MRSTRAACALIVGLVATTLACTPNDDESLPEEDPPSDVSYRLSELEEELETSGVLPRPGWNDHAATVVASNDPGFDLDAPFVLELGRGSGWAGLLPVRVGEDGAVLAHRERRVDGRPVLEHATFVLAPESLDALRAVIRREHITQLAPRYVDPHFTDGSQWVLRIQQGSLEKIVYFSNSFPTQIVALSEGIDRMLDDAGPVAWQKRAPTTVPQPVDRGLWDALHRRDAKLALAAKAERREQLQRFVDRYLPRPPRWLPASAGPERT